MRYMTAARCVCEFRIRLARCVSELMPNWLRARRRGDCVSELMPNWLRARRHGAWSLVSSPLCHLPHPGATGTPAHAAREGPPLGLGPLSESPLARGAGGPCGVRCDGPCVHVGISNAFRVVCDCVHGHVCLS